jgi:hypothetical protein
MKVRTNKAEESLANDPGRLWLQQTPQIATLREGDYEMPIMVKITLGLNEWAKLFQIAQRNEWTIDEAARQALINKGAIHELDADTDPEFQAKVEAIRLKCQQREDAKKAERKARKKK